MAGKLFRMLTVWCRKTSNVSGDGVHVSFLRWTTNEERAVREDGRLGTEWVTNDRNLWFAHPKIAHRGCSLTCFNLVRVRVIRVSSCTRLFLSSIEVWRALNLKVSLCSRHLDNDFADEIKRQDSSCVVHVEKKLVITYCRWCTCQYVFHVCVCLCVCECPQQREVTKSNPFP